MGQVFVRASSRARAYVRQGKTLTRLRNFSLVEKGGRLHGGAALRREMTPSNYKKYVKPPKSVRAIMANAYRIKMGRGKLKFK